MKVKRVLSIGLLIAGLLSLAAAGFLTAGPNESTIAESTAVSLTPTAANPTRTAAPPIVTTRDNRITLTIQDGRASQTITTSAATVADALADAGIALLAADGVWPERDAPPEPGMAVQIARSFSVTILVDGRTIQTRTYQTNSRDILLAAGVNLVGYDYAKPGPNEFVRANDAIQVIRVTEDFRIEDEPIPFQTIWQASGELELDQQAVISVGTAGIQRKRYRLRYENGALVSEALENEWTAREPVNQVVGYGTRIVPRVLETPDGPVEYWRVARMRVTSYTAASSGKKPDDPWYGITASGVPVTKGIVAVDRAIVPFKSYVYVPDYGLGYVADTGGGIRGRWIDLGYDEENFEWWKGYVDVYYLTPAPPPEDINYLLPSVLP